MQNGRNIYVSGTMDEQTPLQPSGENTYVPETMDDEQGLRDSVNSYCDTLRKGSPEINRVSKFSCALFSPVGALYSMKLVEPPLAAACASAPPAVPILGSLGTGCAAGALFGYGLGRAVGTLFHDPRAEARAQAQAEARAHAAAVLENILGLQHRS